MRALLERGVRRGWVSRVPGGSRPGNGVKGVVETLSILPGLDRVILDRDWL
jgi:hypothetical protein